MAADAVNALSLLFMYVLRVNDLSWLFWPLLVLVTTVWTRLYRWYLKKHPAIRTSWSPFFMRGQAQILNSFFLGGTGVPTVIALLIFSPTLMIRGGDFIHLGPIRARSYTSDYVDTTRCAAVTLFARVDPQQTPSQTATVVVYGLHGSAPEGELVRLDAKPAWTSWTQTIRSDRMRVVVDFAGGEIAATATTNTDAGAKPSVDVTLYCAPKPAQPPAS